MSERWMAFRVGLCLTYPKVNSPSMIVYINVSMSVTNSHLFVSSHGADSLISDLFDGVTSHASQIHRCECPKSSAMEHGMTSPPSTGLDFVWVRIMNSSGYHEMKSSRKKTTPNSVAKFMLTIIRNLRGFHLTKVLENGRKFNAGYYIPEILEPLSQWRWIEAAGNERKLLVHADNARPHTAKLSTQYFNENRIKSAQHPPHSPDLSLSDFYLFGYVKRCLASFSFEEADQLLVAVEGVLEGIQKWLCKRSFSSRWTDYGNVSLAMGSIPSKLK
jgi:hypothetical protein